MKPMTVHFPDDCPKPPIDGPYRLEFRELHDKEETGTLRWDTREGKWITRLGFSVWWREPHLYAVPIPACKAPTASANPKVKVKGRLLATKTVRFDRPVVVAGRCAGKDYPQECFSELVGVELLPGEQFRVVEVEVDAAAPPLN